MNYYTEMFVTNKKDQTLVVLILFVWQTRALRKEGMFLRTRTHLLLQKHLANLTRDDKDKCFNYNMSWCRDDCKTNKNSLNLLLKTLYSKKEWCAVQFVPSKCIQRSRFCCLRCLRSPQMSNRSHKIVRGSVDSLLCV